MINNIKLLTAEVASQIAAGEVIERPSSIVKELLENSIDAGSDDIVINIRRSVNGNIIITDNGKGIAKQDLPLAVTQHATSKLNTLDDLQLISSLGFRGEALASICSAAKVKITSKLNPRFEKILDTTESAWSIEVHGDPTNYKISEASHPCGTTIEVRDLFCNIPVRKRFLRSEKTEFQHIMDVFQKIVLSNFSCGFTFISDDKIIYKLPKASTSAAKSNRVKKILGTAFNTNSIYFEGEASDISIKGWLGVSIHRSQSDQQYFFLNNRMIRDKLILHAIRVAYADLIPEGRHPCYVLYLTLDPKHVDINVHPTKHEVRFSESRWVHQFIVQQLSNVLHHTQSNSTTSEDTYSESVVSQGEYYRNSAPMRKISGYENLVKKYQDFAEKQSKLGYSQVDSLSSTSLSKESPQDSQVAVVEQSHLSQGVELFGLSLTSSSAAPIYNNSSRASSYYKHAKSTDYSTYSSLSQEYFTNKLGKIIIDLDNNYLVTQSHEHYFLVDLHVCYAYVSFNKLFDEWQKNKVVSTTKLLLSVSLTFEQVYNHLILELTGNTLIPIPLFIGKLQGILKNVMRFGFDIKLGYLENTGHEHEFSDDYSGELVNMVMINSMPQACRFANPAELFLGLVLLLFKENSELNLGDLDDSHLCSYAPRLAPKGSRDESKCKNIESVTRSMSDVKIAKSIFNAFAEQALGRLKHNLHLSEQQLVLDELAKIDYNPEFCSRNMIAKKLTPALMASILCSN